MYSRLTASQSLPHRLCLFQCKPLDQFVRHSEHVTSFMTSVKVRDTPAPLFLVVLSPLWELYSLEYAWKGNQILLEVSF